MACYSYNIHNVADQYQNWNVPHDTAILQRLQHNVLKFRSQQSRAPTAKWNIHLLAYYYPGHTTWNTIDIIQYRKKKSNLYFCNRSASVSALGIHSRQLAEGQSVYSDGTADSKLQMSRFRVVFPAQLPARAISSKCVAFYLWVVSCELLNRKVVSCVLYIREITKRQDLFYLGEHGNIEQNIQQYTETGL